MEKNFVPLAARIRDESAGLRRKRRSLDLRPPAAPSRLPLRPACRSVPAHALRKKVSLASSSHPPTSGPHFLTRAQEIPKLAVHKFSFRGTRQLLLYLRTDSTKINFAAVIIASRSRGPGSTSRVPEHSGGFVAGK